MNFNFRCEFLLFFFALALTSWADECEVRYQENHTDMLQNISSESDYQGLLGQRASSHFVKYSLDLKNQNEIYFQNTNKYEMHLDYLHQSETRFKGIGRHHFNNMVFNVNQKQLSIGSIYYLPCLEFRKANSEHLIKGAIGFSLIYPRGKLTIDEIVKVKNVLKQKVKINNLDFIFLFNQESEYNLLSKELSDKNIYSMPHSHLTNKTKKAKTYHASSSFGYLRIISLKEYEEGQYSNRDILVFDEVPLDIGPLSGIISSKPQVPHSHVIIRSQNQNIPNIYIPNAKNNQRLKSFRNKLVQLITKENGEYDIKEGNREEAKVYFASRVPALPPLKLDLSERKLFQWRNQNKIGNNLAAKYGAKGVNFAHMDLELSKSGVDRDLFRGSFLIPFSYYQEHVNQKLNKDMCRNSYEACHEKYKSSESYCINVNLLCRNSTNIQRLISKVVSLQKMQSHPKVRKTYLYYLRHLIKSAKLDPIKLNLIKNKISESYPDELRIRFRSSTNAEDLPGMSGAGLYSSKSGCLKKNSTCKTAVEIERTKKRISALERRPEKNQKIIDLIKDYKKSLVKTKSIQDALKSVFASLWNERAFLSRSYYNINHAKVKMGVLVHPSFIDEKANGVVFFEQNNKDSIKVTIVSQVDEISVTNPELPNAEAEVVTLISDKDGRITDVKYLSHSNMSVQKILSNQQIKSLVDQLNISLNSQRESGEKSKRFDAEFKVSATGKVQMKQIRPLASAKLAKQINQNIPSQGSFNFKIHNHGWNSFAFNLGDYQFRFSTPEDDLAEDGRNTTFGWRAILFFNKVEIIHQGKLLEERSLFEDQKSFQELVDFRKLDKYDVSDIFCQSTKYLKKEFPYSTHQIIHDFTIPKISLPKKTNCHLQVKKPVMIKPDYGEPYLANDQICLYQSKKFGLVKFYIPKKFGQPIPYVNEVPVDQIEGCVGDQIVQLKLAN